MLLEFGAVTKITIVLLPAFKVIFFEAVPLDTISPFTLITDDASTAVGVKAMPDVPYGTFIVYSVVPGVNGVFHVPASDERFDRAESSPVVKLYTGENDDPLLLIDSTFQ